MRLPPLSLPAALAAVVALAALWIGGGDPRADLLRVVALALLALAVVMVAGELLLRRRLRTLLRAVEGVARPAPAPPGEPVPTAVHGAADLAAVAASLERVTAGLQERVAAAERALAAHEGEGPGAEERLRAARALARDAADELEALLAAVRDYVALVPADAAASAERRAGAAAIDAGARRAAALARRLRAFAAGAPATPPPGAAG